MNDRHSSLKKHYAATLLLSVLLTIVASTYIVHVRLLDLHEQLETQISLQQNRLVTLAQTTARNGADADAQTIIRDCSIAEREEFDTLLGRLNEELTQAELLKLERLFGRCGSFYAERKAVMVARLVREVDVYDAYTKQIASITKDDVEEKYHPTRWKELAEKETVQNESFSKLVPLQDKIISTLLSGKSIQSPELQAALQEARDVQEMLIVTNTQASQIRAELISQ